MLKDCRQTTKPCRRANGRADGDESNLAQDVVAANQNGLLLFNRWESADVEVKDISLTDYIQVRNAISLPHTAGRYAAKQFRKAQMPIVERLVNR